MKEVLIITNYFPPEMGAASNRIFQLADGLSSDYNISILCPLPNYPKGKIFEGYKGKLFIKEHTNNITVKRLWVFASVSKNKLIRLFSMLSFSLGLAFYFITNRIPKTVIIQSPPLLVAFASVVFLRGNKRKIILNISDLWPSAGLELGAIKKGWTYKMLKKIERFNYKNSNLILGQSEEILKHVSTITDKDTFLYRNYPDVTPPDFPPYNLKEQKKIKLVYAGLLGVAQGILKLCEALDFKQIEFHIYGSGAEKRDIETFIKAHQDKSIVYHGNISRAQLHVELMQYDATIIPLTNRIYGSVPSKIFEYAKLGMPIIYLGGGEGEDVVKDYGLGWVAEAGNYKSLNALIDTLKKEDFSNDKKEKIRTVADKNFDFKAQLSVLKNLI